MYIYYHQNTTKIVLKKVVYHTMKYKFYRLYFRNDNMYMYM